MQIIVSKSEWQIIWMLNKVSCIKNLALTYHNISSKQISAVQLPSQYPNVIALADSPNQPLLPEHTPHCGRNLIIILKALFQHALGLRTPALAHLVRFSMTVCHSN